MSDERITIERSYPAPPERLWELWTTEAGIESWWPPEGFTCEVEGLELEPGGTLRYALTARGDAQVEFMRAAGMPLRTEARKTFTEVVPCMRLAYDSLIDFVPGVEPYEQATEVELRPDGKGVRVVMAMEPLHDAEWTERLVAGRTNELDNLARLLERTG
jgi:uncharacterized protein YndB with AHSA1/START domain